MSATGTAIVDFGAIPGTDYATIAVTGQTGILAGSRTEAWLDPTQGDTPEHSVDEHIMAATMLGISCSLIVVGTGFTINVATQLGRQSGRYNLAWAWT